MAVPTSIITRDLSDLTKESDNIYESIVVVAKRAIQLAESQKTELSKKLEEFASPVDNLEEIFENKEQIEISRYYERLPKSSNVALEDFIAGKISSRAPEVQEEK